MNPFEPSDPVPLPFPSGALIGMVHLGPLPGTPRWPVRHALVDAPEHASTRAMAHVVANAIADARALAEAGFDAVLVENMHDAPYLRRSVGPEIVAAMTAATQRVADAVDLPVGVQVLAGANDAALAVAFAGNAQFIRAEGFVFAAVADEGLLDVADAGPLLRYRRAIGATHIAILADIRKKHSSHALTGDLGVAGWAGAAHFTGADAVILTGATTGAATDIAELAAARRGGPLPVGVGSGVTVANVAAMLAESDFAIVGSSIKRDGDWRQPVDPQRAAVLVRAVRQA